MSWSPFRLSWRFSHKFWNLNLSRHVGCVEADKRSSVFWKGQRKVWNVLNRTIRNSEIKVGSIFYEICLHRSVFISVLFSIVKVKKKHFCKIRFWFILKESVRNWDQFNIKNMFKYFLIQAKLLNISPKVFFYILKSKFKKCCLRRWRSL